MSFNVSGLKQPHIVVAISVYFYTKCTCLLHILLTHSGKTHLPNNSNVHRMLNTVILVTPHGLVTNDSFRAPRSKK